MFPPPKKASGPPQQGPPPGIGMPQPGQMGPPPMPGMPPGFPPPGGGADPMAAMMGQLGPGMMDQQQPPPSFPAGPEGMPFGGSMPDDMGDDSMGGSDSPLLASLMGSMSQDPYGVAPGEPDHALDGGTADPSMGLQELLQMLALGQIGVGGGPQQGGSGLSPDMGSSGMMQGY